MSEPGEKKKRATYQDILDAPPNKIAEIINGALYLSPRPAGPHTSVASSLGIDLGGPFHRGRGGPGGWVILDEPELLLGDDVLVPDLGGWRRERMRVIPEKFEIVPDWACEVLSRSTEQIDRREKMPIYASCGVHYLWLVSPAMRSLEAYRLEGGKWLQLGVYKEQQRARIEPFDAIELDLAALWQDMPLPTRASEGAAQYEW